MKPSILSKPFSKANCKLNISRLPKLATSICRVSCCTAGPAGIPLQFISPGFFGWRGLAQQSLWLSIVPRNLDGYAAADHATRKHLTTLASAI